MPEFSHAGYSYLVKEFSLDVCELFHQCFITDKAVKSIHQKGWITRVYYPRKRVTIENTWQSQITFALKYEGVNIEVLRALFKKLPPGEVANFIAGHPLGNIPKRIWYLYELLTGTRLNLPDGNKGSYVPLIDETLQVALPLESGRRIHRYHIIDNLVGNTLFSPYVRLTDTIRQKSPVLLKKEMSECLKAFSPDLLYRAVQYLYVKETKSSFAIERETPDQRRTDAFVAVLRRMSDKAIGEHTIVSVQNAVVEKRYCQESWRKDQVFVGETLAPGYEKVHYVAPGPEVVNELMEGFLDCLDKWLASSYPDPIVIAAVISFAFVFIHPFDDGNGRVHRYLMHAILAQRQFVPEGLIFPVSATILKKQAAYDKALESFSSRLLQHLDYILDENGELTVRNKAADFYRAIDYTPIVEYFYGVVQETIRTEWKVELEYLKRYDEVRAEMRNIVDMPEKKANQFVLFVQQNGGRISDRKRNYFPELTDGEIRQLEDACEPLCRQEAAARRSKF